MKYYTFYSDQNFSIISFTVCRSEILWNAITCYTTVFWLEWGGLLRSNYWHESSSQKLDEHLQMMYDMPWN